MDSLGTKLKQTRENLKVTIDQVSEKTKIRPYILAAIEEDSYDEIDPVYLKAFIKTYSSYLKIPNAELQPFLEQAFRTTKKDTAKTRPVSIPVNKADSFKDKINSLLKKSSKIKVNQQNIINYLIYAGLGLASFALIYFALFSNGSSSGGSSESPIDRRENQSDAAEIKSPENGLQNFFEKQDSIQLEATATDTAWLRIEIDGRSSDPVVMTPNMTKKWFAKKYFLINLGNAGAVRFLRNGVQLGPFGPKGSVVRNLRITADKVESSATPWQPGDSQKKANQQKKVNPPPIIEPSKPVETPVFKDQKQPLNLRKKN